MQLATSPIWKDMSPETICSMWKLNRDNICVYLKKSKRTATGFEVNVLKLNTAKDVQYAKQAGAIIIPRAQYATIANTVNNWTLHPVLQFAQTISNTYKAGYLASVGTVFRNMFSGVMNNYFTMDREVNLPNTIKHWFQSLKDYMTYTQIVHDNLDEMAHIFRDSNVDKQLSNLTELFKSKNITSMSAEYFREMHSFMQHQASGGLSAELLNTMGVLSKAAKNPHSQLTDQYYKILYSIPHIQMLSNTNNIIEHASRWSLYTMQIQNGATVNEAISAVIRTHFDYSDKTYAQYVLEIFIPFMSFSMKNLEYYANLVNDCSWVLPTLRDVMTPIWNFDSLTASDEQLYNAYDRSMSVNDYINLKPSAPWTQIQAAQLYHMLAGNIILPLDKTAYKTYEDYNGALKKEIKNVYQVFKLNPAFMDAVNLVFNPTDSIAQRMIPPVQFVGDWLWSLVDEKQSFKFDPNVVPIVGPLWQRFAGDALFNPTVKTVIDKVQDSDNILNGIIPSMFSTAYLSPTRIEDVKTPEQLERFLYKQKFLYQKYGLEQDRYVSNIYLNMRRNKIYPRKFKVYKSNKWKAATNYKQHNPNYQTYYTTQRSIDRQARGTIYEKLYTAKGYSRIALNMGPTTSKNLKHRIAAIKNMYRYR
jgi:hypothetical protein